MILHSGPTTKLREAQDMHPVPCVLPEWQVHEAIFSSQDIKGNLLAIRELEHVDYWVWIACLNLMIDIVIAMYTPRTPNYRGFVISESSFFSADVRPHGHTISGNTFIFTISQLIPILKSAMTKRTHGFNGNKENLNQPSRTELNSSHRRTPFKQ